MQNIHKGKDDGEECRHVPELVPVPRGGENTADGSETSELLGSFLGEEIFHLAYVAFQSLYPQRYAGRERGKETVFLADNGQQFVGCRTCCYVTPLRTYVKVTSWDALAFLRFSISSLKS